MALSDELAKLSSERYCLIKVTPSLRLNTLLSVKSGTTYTCTFTNRFEVSSVKVDGTAYTESTTVNPAASKYYYNIDSGVFEINFNAAIGTKQAILFFNLRFTDSEYSVFDENGVKDALSSYAWQCRVGNPPEFEVSVKDMLAGVTSISASSFTVLNDDAWMHSYVGGEYSYFNKDCTVWLCVNNLVSAKFSGNIKDINQTGDDYSLTIYDYMYKLNEPCLMGDTNEDAIINRTTYTQCDLSKVGNVIPYVIGTSQFAYVSSNGVIGANLYFFDTSKTLEATCISTDSLTWALCRSGTIGQKVTSYGTVSAITEGGLAYNYGSGTANRRQAVIDTSADNNIELHDTVELIKGGTTYQGVVLDILDKTSIYAMMESGTPAGAYTSVTGNPDYSVGLMLVQGSYTFFPLVTDDYQITTTTLASGNKLYKIVFTAGFTGRHPGSTAINFLTDKLYFRYTEDIATTNNTKQSKALTRVLEGAGMTVDATSFANTEVWATLSNVAMSIPGIGESSVGTFAKYAGDILKSTLGYIYKDNSTLTVKYKLFLAPSSANLILSNEILDLSVSFNGSDMAQNVRAYADSVYNISTEFSGSSPDLFSASLSSSKAKYLHGLTNQVSILSVFYYVSNTLYRHTYYAENVQTFVTFSTASKFSNLNIGDDVAISDARIPGSKTTYAGYSCSLLKIIGIKYGSDKITFTTTDYKVT